MRRTWTFLALAALLVGCSAHTRYAVEVNVASLLGSQAEDTVDFGAPTAFQVYLPDQDQDYTTPDLQGYLARVPGRLTDALDAVAVDLEAAIENQAAGDLTLTAALYLAPEDESNIYQPQYKAGEASLEPRPLAAGASGSLTLKLKLQNGDPGFATIKNGHGSFRVGLRLEGSGQKFHFRLAGFTLRLTSEPLGRLAQGL